MATAGQSSLQLLLLGMDSSGKTALFTRYLTGRFPTHSDVTLGLEFRNSVIQLDNQTLSLQIWDCTGNESIRPQMHIYGSGKDCCMLVFDVTQQRSFSQVGEWRDSLRAFPKEGEDIPFVLVGNKADKEWGREVQWSEAQTWARSHNMPYIEVSARQGTNVQVVFEEAARIALKRRLVQS